MGKKKYLVAGWIWIGNVGLKRGDLVIIGGLKSKPEWNDKFGIICDDFNARTERYGVKLQDDESQKGLIKIDNVMGVKWDSKLFKKVRSAAIHFTAIYRNHIDINLCAYCGIKRGYCTLYQCKRCNKRGTRNRYVIRYCSKYCQKRHWHFHKNVCGSFHKSEDPIVS